MCAMGGLYVVTAALPTKVVLAVPPVTIVAELDASAALMTTKCV